MLEGLGNAPGKCVNIIPAATVVPGPDVRKYSTFILKGGQSCAEPASVCVKARNKGSSSPIEALCNREPTKRECLKSA